MLNKSMVSLGTWAGAIDYNGKLWFSSFDFNGLFKFDFNTENAIFVKRFEYASNDVEALHLKAFSHKKSIFFIPSSKTEYVCALNVDTEELLYIKLPYKMDGLSYKRDNKIVLKLTNDYFCELNCDDYSLDINCFFSDFTKKRKEHSASYVERINGNKYYFIDNDNRKIMMLDLDSGESETLIVNDNCNKILNVFYFQGKYWVIQSGESDVVAISKEAKYEVYSADDVRWIVETNDDPYGRFFCYDNTLWLLGYYIDGVYVVIGNSLKRIFFDGNNYELKRGLGYGAPYNCIVEHEDELFILPQRSSKLLRVKKTDSVKGIDFSIDSSKIPYYYEWARNKMFNGVFYEGSFDLDFKSYLEIINGR